MIIYVIIIFALLFFFFRENQFRLESMNKWTWPGVFVIHVLAGLAFLYVYTYIEGDGVLSQDAGAYMEESKILQNVFFESPLDYFKLLLGFGDTDLLTQQYLLDTNHWDIGSQAISNESRNMIRFHSVLQFVSFDQPVIHVLFMSMFSTLSSLYLFRVLSTRTSVSPFATIALLTFLPNVLFWSNGILKEPLYLFGFSLILFSLFTEKGGYRSWISFTIGIILLLLFKLHFLIIVLIGMGIWQLSGLFRKKKILWTVVSSLTAVILIFSISDSLRTKITNTVSRKQFDFKNISQGGLHADTDSCFYYFAQDQLGELMIDGDSVNVKEEVHALRLGYNQLWPPDTVNLSPQSGKWKIHFMRPKSDSFFELGDINNSFSDLLLLIPEALTNSFFRPFFNEPGGLFKWVSILEWLFVWVLFIISLKWFTMMNTKSKEMFIFLGTVIILSALLIGWTTPVSGAIVRYRVPIHICMIVLILNNWNKKHITHE